MIIYTNHFINRMLKRNINKKTIENILNTGNCFQCFRDKRKYFMIKDKYIIIYILENGKRVLKTIFKKNNPYYYIYNKIVLDNK